MKMVACPGRITAGQALAGGLVLLVALLFSRPSRAGGDDHRALQLLLDKNIITQQEYDQAVQEEEREKQDEKQASGDTKHGLEVKLGGFAEIDFFGDNTRSFEEIIGNRPVLRSNTVGGANSMFHTSPRSSRISFDVQAPERDGINSRYFAAIDFLGNQPSIGLRSV
jgi:hypothetical protein